MPRQLGHLRPHLAKQQVHSPIFESEFRVGFGQLTALHRRAQRDVSGLLHKGLWPEMPQPVPTDAKVPASEEGQQTILLREREMWLSILSEKDNDS